MSYYNYHFQNAQVEKLLHKTLAPSWVYQGLPWDNEVVKDHLIAQDIPSLLENLPEFKLFSPIQQRDIRFKEGVYHLSNLLAGEHKAVGLAAQVLVESPQDVPDWIHSLNTIVADETKHFLALSRYLQDKVGTIYQPHPRLKDIFVSLSKEKAFEVKLFSAQVVLEWTASSLLASLLFKKPEPLLAKIIRRILQDEGRHLNLNRLVFAQFDACHMQKMQRPMEDMLYEVIVAVISSFFAIPVWQEYGFSKESCQHYALAELEQKGVMRFYTQVLPQELHRCHIGSDRLVRWLKEDLHKKIIQDHWDYEAEIMEERLYAT